MYTVISILSIVLLLAVWAFRVPRDRFEVSRAPSIGWVNPDDADVPRKMLSLMQDHDAVVLARPAMRGSIRSPVDLLSANRGGLIAILGLEAGRADRQFLLVSRGPWCRSLLTFLVASGELWRDVFFRGLDKYVESSRGVSYGNSAITVFGADQFPPNTVFHYPLLQYRPARRHHVGGIPKLIVQTWVESGTNIQYIKDCQDRVLSLNAGYEYVLFTDFNMKRFVESQYGEEYLRVYESILPGAYRSDFFRLLFLLKHGGIYADVSLMFAEGFDSFLSRYPAGISFVSPIDNQSGHLCLFNAFMMVSPGHPVVEENIRLIMGHVLGGMRPKDTFSPEPCLYLTGPCSLGEAFLRVFDDSPTIVQEETHYSGVVLLKHIHAKQSIQTIEGTLELAHTRHRLGKTSHISEQMKAEVGKPHYSQYCAANEAWLNPKPFDLIR